MPAKTMVLNIISVVLQYSLIALIYYFLAAVIKAIYHDLKQPQHSRINRKPQEIVETRQAYLIVIEKQAVELPFDRFNLGEVTSIGRNDGNDIVIDDKFVSHEHACISSFKGEFWLSDLNSTNHTYLNGNLVKEDVPLKNGDLIKIGAVTFKYER